MFQVDTVIVVWDFCVPDVDVGNRGSFARCSNVCITRRGGVVVSVFRLVCGTCGATISGSRARRLRDVTAPYSCMFLHRCHCVCVANPRRFESCRCLFLVGTIIPYPAAGVACVYASWLFGTLRGCRVMCRNRRMMVGSLHLAFS